MPSSPPGASEPPLRPQSPTVTVEVSASAGRLPLAVPRIRALAQATLRRLHVRHAVVSIACLTNRAMARQNERLLQHRGTTDIITLAFRRRTRSEPVIGDIYIAPDVVRANARAAGISAREEMARVVIHGVLHALGAEHPEAARERSPMWRRQEQLLRSARRAGQW
ncbi:MAG: rRNA maturation RNase YbeY [Gemmatimonadaceae bacterium]